MLKITSTPQGRSIACKYNGKMYFNSPRTITEFMVNKRYGDWVFEKKLLLERENAKEDN